GAVVEAMPFTLSFAGAGVPDAVDVGFDGTNYLVVAAAGGDIWGTRVTTAGVALDTGVAIGSATGTQGQPRGAFDGTRFLVVWNDQRSGTGDIYGGRVDAAGTVLDGMNGFAISSAARIQTDSRVAWDGTHFVVVWADARVVGTEDAYAARVGSD